MQELSIILTREWGVNMNILKKSVLGKLVLFSGIFVAQASFAQEDYIQHSTCELRIMDTEGFLPGTLDILKETLNAKGYETSVITSENTYALNEGSTLLLSLNFNDVKDKAQTCKIFYSKQCNLNVALVSAEMIHDKNGKIVVKDDYGSRVRINRGGQYSAFTLLGLNLGAGDHSYCDSYIEETVASFPDCRIAAENSGNAAISNSDAVKDAYEAGLERMRKLDEARASRQ